MWQQKFERYGSQGFTVVGLALDAEGVAPAKLYYDQHGVTFPALVDPNYATGFGAVPKTFFVDEHGVVQELDDWERRIKPADQLRPVTEAIRAQWSQPGDRLSPAELAKLVSRHAADRADLKTAVELASRYLDLELKSEARSVLQESVEHYDARQVANAGDAAQIKLLGQAYFQLARACSEAQADQVRYATLAFYLNPSVGFGKQIARLIAPEKFDNRPDGRFDNRFREATLRRLQRERRAWLQER